MTTNALVTAIKVNVIVPARLAFQALTIVIEVCNLCVAFEALWLAILHLTFNTVDKVNTALFTLGPIEVIATFTLDANVLIITCSALSSGCLL